MEWNLTEDQQLVKETVSKIAQREVAVKAARGEDGPKWNIQSRTLLSRLPSSPSKSFRKRGRWTKNSQSGNYRIWFLGIQIRPPLSWKP